MTKWRRGSYPKERRLAITRLMARDGTNCTICDLPLDRSVRHYNDPAYITFDHVVPRSLGGLDTWTNRRLAHQCCNNERGNDPLVEERHDV